MTITINVPVAAENGLQEEAKRAGIAVSDLVRQLIEERYTGIEPSDDWERLLFSGGVNTGVSLSNEQMGRESLYQD